VTDRLALIAHELRSPVAALEAIAAAVAERRASLDADDVRGLLRLAVAAVRDVERILVDVTPSSLLPERIDTARLVVDAVTAAGLRSHSISARAEHGLPPLEADPVRLRQALANLIENAVAHSPPGGQVVVSARHVGGRVRIAVADDGDGIAPTRLPLVLEPGVRFAERPGQGLGLAVVRAIAEAHGGALEVESAVGRGSTFTLVLPPAADAKA
jgi:signal transduction histidine kinase